MKMRTIIAILFKFIFKIPLIKKKYFGFYKYFFYPLNLFKDVVIETKFNDFKLILHIDDWIQQNLFFRGEYEKAELKILDTYLLPGDIFIDIGANFGLYSIYASNIVEKKGLVYAFEPFKVNFDLLNQNIEINNFNNIKALKLAVGEKDGFAKLYYDKNEKNLGMVSTSKPLNFSTVEETQIISLDSFLKKEKINSLKLIKIDIEGHEYQALLGMKKLLSKYRPYLLIEILDDNSYQQNIIEFLDDLKYKLFFIDDFGNLSNSRDNLMRMNYFFKPN